MALYTGNIGVDHMNFLKITGGGGAMTPLTSEAN